MFYERVDEYKKKKAVKHPLYYCLHDVANPEMTSFTWREISQLHLLLWGNCYSQIIRNRANQVVELWPLNPNQMEVKRDDKNKIYYQLTLSNGEPKIFAAKDIFHIPGLGFDGRVGYSVLQLARESLGLGISMDVFQSRFYGAGTHLGSIFEHPGKLSKETHDNLVKDLSEKYAGLYKSHSAILLEEGMKYTSGKLGMPLADAEFINSKNFQIADYARWLNISPYKLKDYSRLTFSNVENLSIDFVQDTILPWTIRWEQHVVWKLLNQDERKYFSEFLLAGLLRADMESRNKALSLQRQNGIIDADEWRAIENMNPMKGEAGKIVWMPLNMIDANKPVEEKLEKPDKEKDKEDDKKKDKIENKSLYNEQRSLRAMKSRRRMAIAFKPLFRNMAIEILAKERKGILKITKKTLGQRDIGDFNYEIDKYYDEFKKFVRNKFHSLYIQYGEAIYPIAADEVNADSELTTEFAAYIDEYAEHSANQYVGSSRGQLKSIAQNSKIENAAIAIEDRLNEWDDKRPDKIADKEIISGESGFAQFVFFAAGFSTVWVATGKSCPYCLELDGRIISQGMNFVNAGQSFEPEGAESPMIVKQGISHPPLHSGCDCTVGSA